MKFLAPATIASFFLLAGLFGAGSANAQPSFCSSRTNSTQTKLLECVTLDGVRRHQAAFQAAADANNGIRSAGSRGYLDSALYVARTLEAAGYLVEMQPFTVSGFVILSPSSLAQTAPTPATYVYNSDFNEFTYTAPGDVTASVVAVDLQLGLGNASTSGCEPADFAGFPAGSIALIQRGA